MPDDRQPDDAVWRRQSRASRPASDAGGCARLSDTISPRPCAVSRYISSASPDTGAAGRSAAMLSISTATTMIGVPRNTMRASRTICTRATPGTADNSGRHRRRKPNRAHDDVLGRQHEEIRIERRVHPIDDRTVAGAGHAGKADDRGHREHQRRHARRCPPRRLNQAVRRERAFDRAHPFQHRPQQFAQRERQQRAAAAARRRARESSRNRTPSARDR